MGVRDFVVRAAARRPRVLLVTTPGGTRVRLAAEKELRCRGWAVASTPAGADLLLVAGPDRAASASELDRLWDDMPRPRVRLRVTAPDEVPSALDAGRARLGETEHGRHPQGHGTHADMPGGRPMAQLGEDRDGLTLDRLHVSLGPFLADWPAGLVVRVVMQGDVIQRARLGEPYATGPACPFWSRPWSRASAGERVPLAQAARRRAAAHLDSLGRLLSVAGWPAEAVTARRLRDDLLERAPVNALLPRTVRLARRVGRSRTLYRLTRGIGPLTAADARAAGVSGPAARAGGDVPARYRQWLSDTVDAVDSLRRLDGDATPLDPVTHESPRGRWDPDRPPSTALAALLPRLLEGTELAAARLVVASLDPDPDELAVRRPEVARG
ncbi:hypothetical protein [Streptomyces sp. NBC_01716]|uniref:hypothetical protein n=1 Tax=Streptomyces sp. NBC_01716 TaxID=2975917 RepID=UPI002E324C89|nr:hypothetical protein [Streptomyces sp. NBC_01716]